MVFLATPARICIVWVSSKYLRYGNIQGEEVLRAVVLSLACHDDLLLRWPIHETRPPKASGPGLTVRCADNRTGARDESIIGTALLKSSEFFRIRRASSRPRPKGPRRSQTQEMVGNSSPKRKGLWRPGYVFRRRPDAPCRI